VQSATLRLTVIDDSDDGGGIYSVSNNYKNSSEAWTEQGLVWNNAPDISGSSLDAVGGVTNGQIVEFDVTAAIGGDGVYSFGIRNNSSNVLKYDPKEGSSPPELVIVTGTATKLSGGEFDASDAPLLEEEPIVLPEEFSLAPNYPNPFNAGTTIEYALPEAADVRLVIYNIKGQEVRVLVNDRQNAGYKKINWEGRDDSGYECASGVYFLRLEANKNISIRRITLQK
jgi:hypothetical protein